MKKAKEYFQELDSALEQGIDEDEFRKLLARILEDFLFEGKELCDRGRDIISAMKVLDQKWVSFARRVNDKHGKLINEKGFLWVLQKEFPFVFDAITISDLEHKRKKRGLFNG